MSHHDYSSEKPIHQTVLPRPVTSLGYQVERRVFWEGSKFFKLCSIVFNYAQQIFPGGWKGLQGRLRTPSRPGYGPVSNSFRVGYVQHIFPRGPKIFLASYGPGFAPYCCADRLWSVENERSFVAVVIGNVANKCSSVWLFEKKTQLGCLYEV